MRDIGRISVRNCCHAVILEGRVKIILSTRGSIIPGCKESYLYKAILEIIIMLRNNRSRCMLSVTESAIKKCSFAEDANPTDLDMINAGATKILILQERRAFRERGRIFVGVKITDKITGCSPSPLILPALNASVEYLDAAFVIPRLLTPVTRMRNPRRAIRETSSHKVHSENSVLRKFRFAHAA